MAVEPARGPGEEADEVNAEAADTTADASGEPAENMADAPPRPPRGSHLKVVK